MVKIWPNYLGQVPVDLKETPYAEYKSTDWAMEFVAHYGQIDGAHHKTWVIDQVARILQGTPVVVEKASWDDGQVEYRFWTQDPPSDAYLEWVDSMLGETDEEGESEYSYDTGIAP